MCSHSQLPQHNNALNSLCPAYTLLLTQEPPPTLHTFHFTLCTFYSLSLKISQRNVLNVHTHWAHFTSAHLQHTQQKTFMNKELAKPPPSEYPVPTPQVSCKHQWLRIELSSIDAPDAKCSHTYSDRAARSSVYPSHAVLLLCRLVTICLYSHPTYIRSTPTVQVMMVLTRMNPLSAYSPICILYSM